MVPIRRMVVRHRGEPNGSSGLDFDLADVLQALGSRAVRSEWSGTGLQYCSTDERDVISLELAASGERVLGTALLADQSRILQVIHGEFRAFDAGTLWGHPACSGRLVVGGGIGGSCGVRRHRGAVQSRRRSADGRLTSGRT